MSPFLDGGKRVRAAVAMIRNVSKERAEEQQRADFISTASHEMRTPVAAIEGYLALALNDKVSTIDGRARSYLDKAHASTQSLGKLFQDLLTSAKAEDGRLSSHPVVVELGEFMEKLAGDLRLVAEKKGLFVESDTGNSTTINATKGTAAGDRVVRPLYYVYADPDRLREVITNLFDNAVKYTPEGKISLGVTGNDQVVQCYVKDTGPGIPSEDLPHLFQKFYRVDNSATRTIGGTGLGLFICRKIIELYGGRIWAESDLGKGSSFYINLPRVDTKRAQKLQTATTSNTTVTPTAPAAASSTDLPAASP
jgi:signal transduction histidine kinase